MLRSQLPVHLADRFPQLQLKDTELAVDVILLAIRDALADGGRVKFRGLGSFCVRYAASRTARSPMTGESAAVPAKTRPHFRPANQMRERVENGK